MRLEEYLNQPASASGPARKPKAPEAAPVSVPALGQDTVTISPAARAQAAQAAETLGSRGRPLEAMGKQAEAPSEDSPAITEFKKLMDKMLGRGGVGAPKSHEEKMKELAEQIKKLQARLGEVMSDPKTPDAVKSGQAQSISAQIQALEAQLSELAQQMTEAVGAA